MLGLTGRLLTLQSLAPTGNSVNHVVIRQMLIRFTDADKARHETIIDIAFYFLRESLPGFDRRHSVDELACVHDVHE